MADLNSTDNRRVGQLLLPRYALKRGEQPVLGGMRARLGPGVEGVPSRPHAEVAVLDLFGAGEDGPC